MSSYTLCIKQIIIIIIPIITITITATMIMIINMLVVFFGDPTSEDEVVCCYLR